MKAKDFSNAKDGISWIKWWATEMEKIFLSTPSLIEYYLISKIYKEHKKLWIKQFN